MLCFSDLIKIFQNWRFCLLETFKILASISGISCKSCYFYRNFLYFRTTFINNEGTLTYNLNC